MQVAKGIKESGQFFSFEFFPPKEKTTWPAFMEKAERLANLNPLFASVTYGAGGTSHDNSLEICTVLKKEMGIDILAHLTCVGASEKSIDEFVEQLGKVEVTDILALGGDGKSDEQESQSRFYHAKDLVEYVNNKFSSVGIGVAGYPGGHPDCPSIAHDLKFHSDKLSKGADFTMTQLFFDNRQYFDYVDRLNGMNATRPVIPGVLPIQSLASLRRIMSLCGAAIPGDLYCGVEDAFNSGGDEAVMDFGFEFARKQIAGLLDNGAPGVHIYTLNRAAMCERLISALKQDGYFS
ncbi:methylenetetrahydrofolate reductase [Maridesulfovibrio hydrothermalis]|uniref:Methylenetetrahydrofolate reductase n=1 Tax=Maridesulfovibrio hydrothermalis AM13 = DSM 14728 TaxID=1121451 RepID=L0R852_9BACT|nr:methylenetetrahydrofolate reductase [Maridesulfovibrio hydrothermalis]CCO22380.1 Methylenetetrahydrofolate reductase [Maridesulfovibrio hydrothermalis AM13 = DSM 14728]